MTEHQIITFHREDLIQALEDYYEKIHQSKISIGFDEKSLAESNLYDITIKVVSMGDNQIQAKLKNKYEEANMGYVMHSGINSEVKVAYTNSVLPKKNP